MYDDLDDLNDLGDFGEPGEHVTEGRKRKAKKKLAAVFLAFVMIGAAVGGGAYMFMGGDEKEAVSEAPKPAKTVYVQLPEIVVELSSEGRRRHYLAVALTLSVPEGSDAELALRDLETKIVDGINTRLHHMPIDDVSGSEGAYRVKEAATQALLAASQWDTAPDVLITKMLAN